ncbi:MAG: hypothetical protein ACRET6_05305 [Burkholderiales bacterium]
MTRLLIVAATFAALAVTASASLAADGANREERKARFEEWCKANPGKCEEAKAKAQQRREECKADPEKCRAESKARLEQFCRDNPEKCQEMKNKRQ